MRTPSSKVYVRTRAFVRVLYLLYVGSPDCTVKLHVHQLEELSYRPNLATSPKPSTQRGPAGPGSRQPRDDWRGRPGKLGFRSTRASVGDRQAWRREDRRDARRPARAQERRTTRSAANPFVSERNFLVVVSPFLGRRGTGVHHYIRLPPTSPPPLTATSPPTVMTRGGCNDRSAVPSAACWASPSPSSSGIRRSAPAILYLLLLGLALSPPGSSAAPEDCTDPTGERGRGWLDGFIMERHHPKGFFGPSQLHGKTELVPSATGAFAIEFQDSFDGSKVTDAYYPNRNYTIQLTCVSSCAFLATVEEGITSINSEDQWRGLFLAPAMTRGAYTGNEYSGQAGRYGAARSSTTLSQSYAIMWQAPPALTYLGLTVRVTVVGRGTGWVGYLGGAL